MPTHSCLIIGYRDQFPSGYKVNLNSILLRNAGTCRGVAPVWLIGLEVNGLIFGSKEIPPISFLDDP